MHTENMQILSILLPQLSCCHPGGWNLAAVPLSINSLGNIKIGQEEQGYIPTWISALDTFASSTNWI